MGRLVAQFIEGRAAECAAGVCRRSAAWIVVEQKRDFDVLA